MEIKQIQHEGITYLYYDGNFVEKGSYIIPVEIVLKEVANKYYSTVEYSSFDNKELKNLIREAKSNKAYNFCIKACNFFYEKNDKDIYQIRYILPVLTSLNRMQKQSRKAIEINKQANDTYGKSVFSIPLYTSVAAAYCDIGDYERAKKFCDIAYANQGGSTGIKNELSLVYKRIEKESSNYVNTTNPKCE